MFAGRIYGEEIQSYDSVVRMRRLLSLKKAEPILMEEQVA
jgi:hypothetical protein